jgi:single-strand DNA-binding protein
MATLNKVMLIGRVTKDPEPPRTLPNSGSTVVRFRFAVGRSKKNDQGGWDKDPNQLYIDCEAFSRPDSKRNLPDLITRYVKQGDPLYVEGRLVFEEWDDKATGQKRSKHKIVVDGLEFLGGRSDGEGGGGEAADRSGGYGGGRSGGYGGKPAGGPPAKTSAPPPRDDDEYGGGGGSGGGDGDPIPF